MLEYNRRLAIKHNTAILGEYCNAGILGIKYNAGMLYIGDLSSTMLERNRRLYQAQC